MGGVDCDTSAAASVSVRVVNEAGAPVGDARVTFSHAGGAEQPAECVQPAPDGRSCGGWAAGWEQAGDFVIKAASADGSRQAQEAVSVEAGRCHVVGKQLQLTLR
jgi:hypothetical protein